MVCARLYYSKFQGYSLVGRGFRNVKGERRGLRERPGRIRGE
jgi:hypothetical protein